MTPVDLGRSLGGTHKSSAIELPATNPQGRERFVKFSVEVPDEDEGAEAIGDASKRGDSPLRSTTGAVNTSRTHR
jgi:hypothetical protein